MMETVVNTISARQAIATVNDWLVCYVGDRFVAGTPVLDSNSDLWRVPILYVYPNDGPLGSVGEAAVDSLTGEMRTCPAVDGIKRQALNLYQAHRGGDDTTLPSSRN